MPFRLPQRLAKEIISHAKQGTPEEVCGVLSGQQGRAERLYRADNVAENRRRRYLLDTAQQLKIMRDIESRGQSLVAIYHSHPSSPAAPSETDINLAAYPDAVYLIVSLKDKSQPDLKAFRIVGKAVIEVSLILE